MRLDLYIAGKYALKSRQYAQTLIKEGCVRINGETVKRSSFEIQGDVPSEIDDYLKYVGRGGLKLEKALSCFGIDVKGMTAADIGASTGGFTDCLLQKGASKVYAVDVGHDQLAEKLKSDLRVEAFENTDIRFFDSSALDKIDIVTVDVAFISVEKIAGAVAALKAEHIVSLIKPQFESAKNKNGIVKDKKLYPGILVEAVSSFTGYGYGLVGLTVSPVKGGDGNTEFLAYFRTDGIIDAGEISGMIKKTTDSLR